MPDLWFDIWKYYKDSILLTWTIDISGLDVQISQVLAKPGGWALCVCVTFKNFQIPWSCSGLQKLRHLWLESSTFGKMIAKMNAGTILYSLSTDHGDADIMFAHSWHAFDSHCALLWCDNCDAEVSGICAESDHLGCHGGCGMDLVSTPWCWMWVSLVSYYSLTNPWTMQVFQVMDRPALPFEDAVQSPSVGKPKDGFLLNEVSPGIVRTHSHRLKVCQIDLNCHISWWSWVMTMMETRFDTPVLHVLGAQLINLCTNVMWYSVPSCDCPGKKSPLPHLGSLSNLPRNRINMCTAIKLHMWLWGNMSWNEKTHNHS